MILEKAKPRLGAWGRLLGVFLNVCDALSKGISTYSLIIHPDAGKEVSSWAEAEALAFPEHASPQVSILIPVFEQWAVTYACLRSILDYSGSAITYEILVLDDCSGDETKSFPDKIRGIKYIRNEQNLRFLKNCNRGATFAQGKHLLFLNNDTLVHEGWLEALVNRVESSADIGLVGAKLIGADGLLQEAGGIVWKDGSGWNYGRGESPLSSRFNYFKEPDYCSGACMLIPRHLWEQLGGFDELFAPAYYEDTDLAFEVRKAGYRVVYEPRACVTHLEGVSHGTDTSSGMKKYQIENQVKFKAKWQKELELNQFSGPSELFKAHSRPKAAPVVFIADAEIPHWSESAGARLTWMYVQQFINSGYRVKFLPTNGFGSQPWTAEMEAIGVHVLHGLEYSDIDSWLMRNGRYIDYAYLHRPDVAALLAPLVRKYSKAKLVYQCHDLHHIRHARQWELAGHAGASPEAARWKRMEDSIMGIADVIHTPSISERIYIQKLFPLKKVYDIPVFFYDKLPGINLEPQPLKILFVGGCRHLPNEDAVVWFVEEILPIIKASLPDVIFDIVGPAPTNKIQSLKSSSICVHGGVSDEELLGFYSKTSLVVAPLRFGAGVKGKVIEAMAYGLPVVVTPIGAEGIPLAGSPLAIKETAEEFAAEVISLLGDVDRTLEMSSAGLSFVSEYYSAARVKRIYARDFPR
ncbi:glycosyltransferase [Planctomycetota bacterium]|nr:glycosyltransferase [Planctomycetota bacterium]